MNSYYPKNQADWRKWLQQHHLTEDFVWLILTKKKAQQFNLSWSEAVDEALCFGWIDSTRKTVDDEKYQQYFCKRKPKSNWSKVNKAKVKVLIEQGRMEAEGYKSIERAKANGSWTILDQVEALEVPAGLATALHKAPAAKEYFNSLSKSVKKGLLYWVISAKRTATRQKRIVAVVENASQQRKPKPFRSNKKK